MMIKLGMLFPYLIVQPQGGLCNRMRTIAGAYKLAGILKKRLLVLWVRNTELNEFFCRLFDPAPFRVVEDRPGSATQRWLWRIVRRTSFFTMINDEYIQHSGIRDSTTLDWVTGMKGKNIFIVACHDIIKDCDYSIFKPSESIIKRCPIVTSSHFSGFHIRRTDNEQSIRFSPTELFIQKMKEVNAGGGKIFLTTDDLEEEHLLTDMFSGRIITNSKTSLDRNNPMAIQDALLDLYTLSRCEKIYGSYWSSFSDVAAQWGHVEKIVLKKSLKI